MAEPTDGCSATCAILGYSGTTSFDFARSFIYARLAEVVADCPTLHWKSPMMGPFPIKASDNPESKDRVWSISVNADNLQDLLFRTLRISPPAMDTISGASASL
jgi:hypothetical protein